jgi:protein-tyrosine phosphatase
MQAAECLARELLVRSVVDVREEACDDPRLLATQGISLLHLPTPDGFGFSADVIEQGVKWVRERLGNGGRVFVHCQHGIGRSTLLVGCVLVDQGCEPLQAFSLIKRRRPAMSLSIRQIQTLIAWLQKRRDGSGAPLPTLDEIGRLVWAVP